MSAVCASWQHAMRTNAYPQSNSAGLLHLLLNELLRFAWQVLGKPSPDPTKAKWEAAVTSPLSALVGEWYIKIDTNIPAFEITPAGKFIMAGTTYDISVSGSTSEIKFGGTSVGTFAYAISNDEMVMMNGTGIGITIAVLSPVVKKPIYIPPSICNGGCGLVLAACPRADCYCGC